MATNEPGQRETTDETRAGAGPERTPPIAFAAAPPPAVRTAPSWLNAQSLIAAAVAGAIAIGAAFAVAIIVVLLVLTVSAATGGTPWESAAGSPLGAVSPVAPVVWIAVLGLFGQLTGGISVSALGATGGLSLFVSFVPVLPLFAGVVGAAWWSYRSERGRRTSSRWGLWALGAGTGLVAGILALLLSLAGITSVDGGGAAFGLSGGVVVSTVAAGSFFGPLLSVGLASVAGRWLARGPAHANVGSALWHAPSRFRWGTRDLYDYLVVLAVLFVPISLIGALVVQNGTPAAWPVGVGLLSVAAASVGHLGGYALSQSTPFAAPGSQTVSLFSGLDATALLLVLAAVVAAAAAALLIGRRRAISPVPLGRAWVLPVLVFGASLLIGFTVGAGYLVGAASALGQTFAFGGAVAPTWWTFPVAFLWGVVVEALARYVVPIIVATFPVLGRVRLAGDGIGTAGPAGASVDVAPPAAPRVGAPPDVVAPSVPVDAATTAPPAPSGPPAQPLSRQARRRLLVGGIVVSAIVLLGIAGAVTVSILQSTVFSPRSTVEGYVDDIAAGRFADAWQKDARTASGGDELIASNDVALLAGITDIEIGDPSGTGDTRSIPVTYTVDGEVDSTAITVRSTGKQFVFFDTWSIDTGLAVPIEGGASGLDELLIGGVPVDVADGTVSVIAYPGSYEVTGPPSPWIEVAAEPVVVSQAGGYVSVSAEPTAALADEVQSQVDSIIDACAASTDAEPDGCPFSLYSWREARAVSWTIVEYPTVALYGLGDFSTSDSGAATASYEQQDFFDEGTWTPGTSSTSIWASGEFAIDGDTVTVTLAD